MGIGKMKNFSCPQHKSKFVGHELKIQEAIFLKNRDFLAGSNYENAKQH